MEFLQKYILFTDFCLQAIGVAEIHAVLQEFQYQSKRHQEKLHFRSFIGKSSCQKKEGCLTAAKSYIWDSPFVTSWIRRIRICAGANPARIIFKLLP
ncbi:hypothetical protein L3476_23380 [Paenibacillus thiaminolyticus]|uniref:hypothetical protein n=1 Tax=Paenibacillus thiaminolyticus TaxID=49283 RepID=UPI001163B311|nr:hypothetical protein [Paenibacillus thiaminolyticus]WCR26190.1 hypothetical protein L3476_23380 [Paenibacillus thiaminolyticus]